MPKKEKEKEKEKKRKKYGGRRKGTPNKLSIKKARQCFEEYFNSETEILLEDKKTKVTVTKLEKLMRQLEYLSYYAEKDEHKIKAIAVILKVLGAYDTKINVDLENADAKIVINIGE